MLRSDHKVLEVTVISKLKTMLHNHQIRTKEVRFIDEGGNQQGIVALDKAIEHCKSVGLDLVQVDGNSSPPVCKALKYDQYRFEQSKKVKTQSKRKPLKEIKLRPAIEQNDYNVKIKKITQFIEQGSKVKVSLRYRGREIVHKELGEQLLDRVKHELADLIDVTQQPLFEGRQVTMVISPKAKK